MAEVAVALSAGSHQTASWRWPWFCQRPEGESLLDFGRRLHRLGMLRLRMKHCAGMGGRGIVVGRSRLVDHLVLQVFNQAFRRNAVQGEEGIAILALGGYGREELAPHSDVDLMFLRRRTRAPAESRQIQEMLCLLWDMGIEVGHSVRTLPESLRLAGTDLVSQLSMLDGRRLAGDQELADQLKLRLQRSLTSKSRLFQKNLLVSVANRHSGYGETAFIQEPNVKEAKGGLRDFQVVLWLLKALYSGQPLAKLLHQQGVSWEDWKKAQAAYDFMQRVRNELHFQAGRRDDKLSHPRLGQVLQCFTLDKRPWEKAGEAFLKHYYRQADRVATVLEDLLQPIKTRSRPISFWKLARQLPRRKKGESSSERVASTPEAWVQRLRYTQSEAGLLDGTTRSRIRDNLARFRQADFSTANLGASLRAILRNKGKVARTLRLMHELKLLGRVLPEFGRLTCMVQQDYYHKYTADEHSLRAVEVLDRIAQGGPGGHGAYRQILNEIHDASTLNLALLMHDVGKGRGGDHAERGAHLLRRAASRLGFDPDEIEKAGQLVEQHLLMGQVSQRRNLEDPATIDRFVKQVGRLDLLNMLVLMTYADGQAVAPGLWSDWKNDCLWNLYTKAYDRLMLAQESFAPDHARVELIQEKVARQLGGELDPADIKAHFQLLPERYAIYTRLEHILEHLRLCVSLKETDVRLCWSKNPGKGYSELLLVSRDQPGLFARVAGAITSFNLSILSAQLNTRRDGVVCDVFLLGSPRSGNPLRSEDFPRVGKLIQKALSEQLDFQEEVQSQQRRHLLERNRGRRFTPKVRIHNDISPSATVIEVQAGDRVGLGYQIAKALTELELNITFAKLATEKAHAFDVFYIQDSQGLQVSDAKKLAQISERLRAEADWLPNNRAAEVRG